MEKYIMNMPMKTVAFALAAAFATAGVMPSVSFGALSYKYATSVASLNLSPGQVGSVDLYLVETVTGASTSRLATESGLSSAYVRVSYVPPGSPLASHSTVSAVAANTLEFDDIAGPDTSVAADHNSGFIREYLDISELTGPSGTVTAAGVRQVFLGSVTVLGGTSAGDTTFQVADDPITNDTVTVDGFATPIDANAGIAPVTFTVTVVVPEPAAVLTAGVLILGTLRAWKRRQA